MPNTQEKLRSEIGQSVRRLRLDRRWTQDGLAKLLGLSQNRLSEVENGKGSFTAEQLVTILKTFNVTLDKLVRLKESADELQNALARLGASHLAESTDVLPTERLKEVLVAVPEALASGDPRHVTALAPVLVNHADGLGFTKLYAEAASLGLQNRLGWVIDNTLKALNEVLADKNLAPKWMIRYRTSHLRLNQYLANSFRVPVEEGEDIFDPGVAGTERLAEVKKERSAISKRWHLVTRIQPNDFKNALEQARGDD